MLSNVANTSQEGTSADSNYLFELQIRDTFALMFADQTDTKTRRNCSHVWLATHLSDKHISRASSTAVTTSLAGQQLAASCARDRSCVLQRCDERANGSSLGKRSIKMASKMSCINGGQILAAVQAAE